MVTASEGRIDVRRALEPESGAAIMGDDGVQRDAGQERYPRHGRQAFVSDIGVK